MSACRGQCKGDRGALEPPAELTRNRAGQRILRCPCCGTTLRHIPGYLLDAEGHVAHDDHGRPIEARPPNLSADLDAARKVRMSDEICGYDVVVLAGLMAAD